MGLDALLPAAYCSRAVCKLVGPLGGCMADGRFAMVVTGVLELDVTGFAVDY